jgi:dolichol-phosphate mannosyltransferase
VSQPVFSVVVPVFNEREVLPVLVRRMATSLDQLDCEGEVILVDDGSTDGSFEVMLSIRRADSRFRILKLSRNFGHQTAITAGLDVASGEAVIVMDADLQDPPEVIPELVRKWREGFDVVYGVRRRRSGDSWFKRGTAAVYYRLLRRLTQTQAPLDAGDFRLLDRRALCALRRLRESSRYVRGLVSWIGLKQTGVLYDRAPRTVGATKYGTAKMWALALDGIVGFSLAPLRVVMAVGAALAVGAFGVGCWAIVMKLSGVPTVSGWTSVVVAVSFVGGVQLAVLGVIGEYIGRVYEEAKGRPLYIVERTEGLEIEAEYVPRGVFLTDGQ